MWLNEIRPLNTRSPVQSGWRRRDDALLRYAAVCPALRSQSIRRMRLNIRLNMLHDAFALGIFLSGSVGFGRLPTPYTFG